MPKSFVLSMGICLLMTGIAAPGSGASCVTPKSASTYNPATAAFTYWHSTLAETPGASLVTKMWSGAADVTGNCNFLYFSDQTAGDIGLYGSFGDACLPGAACPVGTVSVLAAVIKGPSTDFLVTQAPEIPSGGVIFDFSANGGPMVPLGRPRVLSSSRPGGLLNLNVAVDSVAAGLYDGTAPQITGYNILSKASSSDPGRLAAGYDPTPAGTIAAPGGGSGTTGVAVDCTSVPSVWLVAQIITVAGPSPVVGSGTRISCNILAEPSPRKLSHKPANHGR